MSFLRTALYASTLLLSAQTVLADVSVDEAAQKDLSLTLYQNGLSFVKDQRRIPLPSGAQTLAIEGISPQLLPDSLLISGEGFRVSQRRFAFDLLTPSVLLEKSVGKTVNFRRPNPVTGKDDLISAKILSTTGGLVIERDGNIETGQPGQLVLDSLPDGLRARPALMVDVNVPDAKETDLGLAYLTNGLNWRASYSVEIDKEAKNVRLTSWANLTNTSGTSYKNVKLSLGAGQIKRQSGGNRLPVMAKAAPRAMAMAMDAAVEEIAPAPVALGGIHLYHLPHKLDLNNQETKQVALMAEQSMKAERVLVKRFGPTYGADRNPNPQPVNPDIELSFKNTSGLPLPSGLARLYRQDQNGGLNFVGEDTLKQSAKGQTVYLYPGTSFDVTLTRSQTDFKVDGKHRFEAAYKVVIKNTKERDETIRVTENFHGEWELIKASVQPTEKLARNAVWEINVPAGQERSLEYHVGVRTR